jgi:N-methylhydantoinase A
VDKATEAVRAQVAEPLGAGLLDAAYGCHELANATMIRAIKSVSVQRGRDPRDFTLVAFGGSGPIHAAGIARELGIKRVLVPPRPGVFSAVGLLQARLECHAKRTYLRRTRRLDERELDEQLAALTRDAREGLGTDALRDSPFETQTWAEMRYVGQGFELPVPLPARTGDWSAWLDELEAAFAAEHRRTYGHVTHNPTEIVHLRVVARETDPPPFPDGVTARASDKFAEQQRPAYFGEPFGLRETPVVRRAALPTEPRPGPLVIEDHDATTVVPPDFSARRGGEGNVIIEVLS